jgi:hypothetical protein
MDEKDETGRIYEPAKDHGVSVIFSEQEDAQGDEYEKTQETGPEIRIVLEKPLQGRPLLCSQVSS